MVVLRRLAGLLASAALAACSAGEVSVVEPDLLEPCEVPGGEDDARIEARCGSVGVPENPSDPAGRQLDLNVLVIPAATTGRAHDPIFYFEGGPGGSSVDAARVIAEYILPKARPERDVVFVDQRGTGASNPLTCPAPETQDLQSLLTSGLGVERALDCLDTLRPRADLTFYSTAHAADDLEAVRTALGYDEINLLGSSYGTRLALSYLRRHPEHVRSTVLVSVMPMDMRVPLTTAVDAQASLDTLISRCKAEETCGLAYPDIDNDLATADAVIREAPVRVTFENPTTGDMETAELRHDTFAASLRALLYEPWSQMLLPSYLKRAAEGDYTPFAEEYASVNASYGEEDFAYGLYYTITCFEGVDFADMDEARRMSEGTVYGDLRVRQYAELCAVWPRASVPDDFLEPIHHDAPVLIFSGGLDPTTPPKFGDRVADQLSNVRHIVVDRDGHNVGEAWPDCAQDIVAEFYATLDSSKLDTACLDNIPWPEWEMP